MNESESQSDCFICRKHRGQVIVPGGAVFEDDLIYVGHAALPEGQPTAYLGAFLIEPKRHVPGLAELNDAEARVIGSLAARIGRALKASEGAEHIYQFVMGHHVDHLHVWVLARYPGAPREYWGTRVDEWPEAPHGGPAEIESLCRRIQSFLAADTGH